MHVSTKLNRSHEIHGREALILPCLGRTEIDVQATGPQGVTVEDSMSMVHLSSGINPPASPHLLSEPVIVARLAHATLAGRTRIDWLWLAEDYRRIRDEIAGMARENALWLGRKSLAARTVTIKVRYGDFTTITRSHSDRPTSARSRSRSARAVPRDMPKSGRAVVGQIESTSLRAAMWIGSHVVPNGGA